MNENDCIHILFSAISSFLKENEGIVIDFNGNRFIVAKTKKGMVINLCSMENCDDEFKNLKSGDLIPIEGTVKTINPGGIH